MRLIFNEPLIYGDEKTYLDQVFNEAYFCGNGTFSLKCENFLKELTNSEKVLMTSSCTAALEICALLLDLKSGDEIILPAFTHVATASAFSRTGAELVWCDIEPQTLNLDTGMVEELITPRTKAIVAVHYAGIPTNPDKLLEICHKYGIYLIEDAAQSIGIKYNDHLVAGFGDLAVMSFHQTKNVHCGEGGALFINNPVFSEKAQFIRDRGTNRDDFNHRKIKAWTWVYQGSNYYLSELQTAFLYAQLIHLQEINFHRLELFQRYSQNLKGFLPVSDFSFIPENCSYNGHMFYLLTDEDKRSGLIRYLKENEIESVFHYIPLHHAPYWGEKYKLCELPVTDSISKRILRLPMHFKLTLTQVDFICATLKSF